MNITRTIEGRISYP